jgi:hypothetical protein
MNFFPGNSRANESLHTHGSDYLTWISTNYNKLSHTNFVFPGDSRANDNGRIGPGPVSDSSPPNSNSSSSMSSSTSANKINKSGVIIIFLMVLLIVLWKRRRPHGNYQQLLIIYCFILPLSTFIKSWKVTCFINLLPLSVYKENPHI